VVSPYNPWYFICERGLSMCSFHRRGLAVFSFCMCVFYRCRPKVASSGVDSAGVASPNDSNSVGESETGGRSITMTSPLFVFKLFS